MEEKNNQNHDSRIMNQENIKEKVGEEDKKEKYSKNENIEKDNKKETKNTTMAFLAYIFFAIPLLTDDKEDPFVKYHVKQSLGLLISFVAVGVFTMVPIVGWIFGPILSLVLFIFWIFGVIHALSGNKKPLPIIGDWASKINI